MKSSVKVKLRRKENKEGLKGIIIQVILDRKSSDYSTNQYVKEALFDNKNGKVKSKHPRAAFINKAISDKRNEIEDIIFHLGQKESIFSLKDINSKLNNIGKLDEITFCGFVENYIKTNPSEWSYSTIVSYNSTLKKLKEYAPKYLCKEVNADYVIGYKKYLSAIKLKRKDKITKMEIEKSMSSNSIKKELKNLRKLCNVLIKDGIIAKNPFVDISVGEIKGEREYLEIDELKRFSKIITNSDYEKMVKDLFLFSVYTGLRISDIFTLKPSHLTKLRGGVIRLSKLAKKKPGNGQRILLEFNLNNFSIDILKSYNVSNNDKYCFPPLDALIEFDEASVTKKISSIGAYFNTLLKEMINRAEITKDISMHCGRHSFATLSITNGADVYVLGKVMGHKKITSTQVYADVIDSRKDDLLKLMDEI